MLEFWGSFNRHSINLCRELCRPGLDLTLISVEDCVVEPALPCRVMRLFPSFTHRRGTLSKLLRYLQAYGKVLIYTLRERVDMVHFQYFRLLYADWIFVLIMRLLGLKVIYNAHNVMPHESSWYHSFVMRLVYRVCDLVIVTSSPAMARVRSEFGVRPGNIRRIPIGNPGLLDSARVAKGVARKILDIPADHVVLLQFGVIRPYKGIDVLIDALSTMGRDCPKLLCIVVGQCDDIEFLQGLKRRVSLERLDGLIRIRERFLTDRDIELYMSACDAVVLPYREASGQSGVLLLAYAFSKPVIASRVGGLTDMVEHGKSGYLVPAGDPGALADTIRLVLENKSRLHGMGTHARHLNETKYSWTSIAAATVQAYRSILERP